MNNLSTAIQAIRTSKKPVYFISPHLDDAVLSCGGLIHEFTKKKVPVTVVTVFTSAHGKKATLSARRFLKKCGEVDTDTLFEKRRKEDITILKKSGVKYVHLGCIDGTWRMYKVPSKLRKLLGNLLPEFIHLYPTFLHVVSGKLHSEDTKNMNTVAMKLKNLVPKNAVIFGPLAIGNHVDHVFVREVLSEFENVIYWSDFPYNLKRSAPTEFIKINSLKRKKYLFNKKRKHELIKGYASQLAALFVNDTIPDKEEVYYLTPKFNS